LVFIYLFARLDCSQFAFDFPEVVGERFEKLALDFVEKRLLVSAFLVSLISDGLSHLF
jgi:hypothetical protein